MTSLEAIMLGMDTAELLDGLLDAFRDMHKIREATGDPAARGVQACIDHITALRDLQGGEGHG